MTDAIQGIPADGRLRLKVGVPDVLPKLVVFRLLEPALSLDVQVNLETYEGKFDDLLGDLATHRLDVLISETPLPPGAHVRAFNYRLGGCTLTCFGTSDLYDKYRRKFPQSLTGAPMLLPTQNTVLRRAIEQWLDENEVKPKVMHEFEDSALLKVFGQSGAGLFFAPTAIKKSVSRQYNVKALGEVKVFDNFYAISVERRLKHPAVIALCEAARTELFDS
jgi:LysR family transcriptional activator of nhaA